MCPHAIRVFGMSCVCLCNVSIEGAVCPCAAALCVLLMLWWSLSPREGLCSVSFTGPTRPEPNNLYSRPVRQTDTPTWAQGQSVEAWFELRPHYQHFFSFVWKRNYSSTVIPTLYSLKTDRQKKPLFKVFPNSAQRGVWQTCISFSKLWTSRTFRLSEGIHFFISHFAILMKICRFIVW